MNRRADLEALARLAGISDAKKAIATTELAHAEQARHNAVGEFEAATIKVAERYDAWRAGIGSSLLGPQMLDSLATSLLAAESGLTGADKQLAAAEREAEEKRQRLIFAEARLRAEQERLGVLRRRAAARIEEHRQDQLTDLNLQRWYRPS